MGRGGNQDSNLLYGQKEARKRAEQNKAEEKAAKQRITTPEEQLGVREVFIQNDMKVAVERLDKLTQPVILERQQVQQIKISPTNVINLLLIENSDSKADKHTFFVRQKDLQKAASQSQAFQQITSTLPAYRYLNDRGLELLNNQPAYNLYDLQENDLTDKEYFLDDPKQLKQLVENNQLQEDKAVYFHSYNYSLWPVNGHLPLSTVDELKYSSEEFDLDKLVSHFENHPMIKDIDLRDNHGMPESNPELFIKYKLPQDVYNKLYLQAKESEQKKERDKRSYECRRC
jgi:hypothetical protein